MSLTPTAANQNTALTYRPTLFRRLLTWIGFGPPPPPNMDDLDRDPQFAAGMTYIHSMTKLSFRTRLLILLGGNLATVTHIKSDVQVKKAASRSVTSIIAPGDDFQ